MYTWQVVGIDYLHKKHFPAIKCGIQQIYNEISPTINTDGSKSNLPVFYTENVHCQNLHSKLV